MYNVVFVLKVNIYVYAIRKHITITDPEMFTLLCLNLTHPHSKYVYTLKYKEINISLQCSSLHL